MFLDSYEVNGELYMTDAQYVDKAGDVWVFTGKDTEMSLYGMPDLVRPLSHVVHIWGPLTPRR